MSNVTKRTLGWICRVVGFLRANPDLFGKADEKKIPIVGDSDSENINEQQNTKR